MEIALWERNRDIRVSECLIDREIQVACHLESSFDSLDPDAKFEIQ